MQAFSPQNTDREGHTAAPGKNRFWGSRAIFSAAVAAAGMDRHIRVLFAQLIEPFN